MNNANIQKFIGFINDVCAKYECVDAAKPLADGWIAFCEAAFQHPTFEDPAQHKAYWKNVFFRLKTCHNVARALIDQFHRDEFNRPVSLHSYLRESISEKRDKSGVVWKLFGYVGWSGKSAPVIEFTFTMPEPSTFDVYVSCNIGRKKIFDTVIPESELASTNWKYDGENLKDPYNINLPVYEQIKDTIHSADQANDERSGNI